MEFPSLPPVLYNIKTVHYAYAFCFIFFALFVTFLVLYCTKSTTNATGKDVSKLLRKPMDQVTKVKLSHNNEKEEFVTVHLEGGLGNQLFEIATAFAYAKRFGKTLVLDHSVKGVSLNSFSPRPTYFSTILQWTPNDPDFKKKTWIEYKEPHFHYAAIDNYYGNIRLNGYFQSPKYFQEYADELKNKIFNHNLIASLAPQIHVLNMDNLEAPKKYTTVSIHVRRGDYINNSQQVLLPITYYTRAVSHMREHTNKDLQFVIFSDDIPWCKANIDKLIPSGTARYFIGDNGEKPTDYQELLLMSLCDHHIIANSSFSWFGAWLGGTDGIVVAPKQWFKHSLSPKDIYCDKWVVL
jgi:hypothetical protein